VTKISKKLQEHSDAEIYIRLLPWPAELSVLAVRGLGVGLGALTGTEPELAN